MLKTMEKTILPVFESNINREILYDMIVDRIPSDLIDELPLISNEEFIKSLKRGNYFIVKDDKVVAYYDMYAKYYKSFNTKKKCDLVSNAKYKGMNTYMHDIANIKGYIDIVQNKDKTSVEPKSKIKQNNNPSSYGSACISTSTINKNMLKGIISEYNDKLNMDKSSKTDLCIIYEYTLRSVNQYLRTIEYNLLLKN